MYLTCVRLKYESSIHNIAFSSETNTVVLSESGEKCAPFKRQNITALKKYFRGFWCERTTWDGQYHRRKHYYGLWYFDQRICFLHTQLFTLKDINRWTGVVWIIDVFISCLDYHSGGTHSLQSIHWWASDLMLHFSKSVPLKKQTLFLDGLQLSTFSGNDHFWVCHVFNDRTALQWNSFSALRRIKCGWLEKHSIWCGHASFTNHKCFTCLDLTVLDQSHSQKRHLSIR